MTYIIYWASDRFMSQVASRGPHKFTCQVSHTLVKNGLITRSHAPPRGYTVWPSRPPRGYTVFSWPRCIFLKLKNIYIYIYKILFSLIRKSLILRNCSLIFKFLTWNEGGCSASNAVWGCAWGWSFEFLTDWLLFRLVLEAVISLAHRSPRLDL